MSGALRRCGFAAALALLSGPAPAQEAPIGPCSPFRAADGDIPSEMPGCARHRRPTPGSLDDELEFVRRRHDGAATASDEPGDDAPTPRHRARRRRD